jgi:hypothetical protein
MANLLGESIFWFVGLMIVVTLRYDIPSVIGRRQLNAYDHY